MKKFIILLLLLAVSFSTVSAKSHKVDLTKLTKRTAEWQKEHPNSLPHWMTSEEMGRTNEIGRDFVQTDPPVGEPRQTAEFERMQGVLIRYPFGIPMNLIKQMSMQTKVVTIVSSASQQNTVLSQYTSEGVNTDNCEFLTAPTDSYWTRDYGPWYVVDGNNDVGICDFIYNRPRPNDSNVPGYVANYLNETRYGMSVVHTGGNYMTDGMGIAASTKIVYTESMSQQGITEAEVNERMHDYLGIDTYHVVDDPNNTYIDHIDCWGKFLDVDKILIRSVPSSHPQYSELEATASYFANQTSSYGNKYQVYRVNTPNNEPYTNSLILNDHVYVPTMKTAANDSAALIAYRTAMPGYTVVAIPGGTEGWESTDALHCRTRGIADKEMLHIYHVAKTGLQPAPGDYDISAKIVSYGGHTITNAKLYYKINAESWNNLDMAHSGDTYTATIPHQSESTEISYYIHAEDNSGRSENHPFIGQADPHTFTINGSMPSILVTPDSITHTMSTNGTATKNMSITNNGEAGTTLNYTITTTYAKSNTIAPENITGSTFISNLDEYIAGETFDIVFSVSSSSNDDEYIYSAALDFPEGVTVNSSTNFVGGTEDLTSNSATGNGANLSWLGSSPTFGSLHPGETATSTVNVSVSSSFSGDMDLAWILQGDNYGSAPHTLDGTITLGPGIVYTWLSVTPTSGNCAYNETDNIDVNFDATDLAGGTYNANITISSNGGDDVVVPVTLTISSAINDKTLPTNTTLYQNYPNPFNPETAIKFYNSKTGLVKLSVFNAKGEFVANLVNTNLEQGLHSYNFDATKFNSGIYYYTIKANGKKMTKKMILIK